MFFLNNIRENNNFDFYASMDDLTESIYNVEAQYKDTLIECMQEESSSILNEGIASKVWEGLKKFFEKIVKMVKTILTKIKNFFGKLFGRGKKVSQELDNAIKNSSGSSSSESEKEKTKELPAPKETKQISSSEKKSLPKPKQQLSTPSRPKIENRPKLKRNQREIKGHAIGSYPLFTRNGQNQLVSLIIKPMNDTQAYINNLQKNALSNPSADKFNDLKSKNIPTISKKIESITKVLDNIGEATGVFTVQDASGLSKLINQLCNVEKKTLSDNTKALEQVQKSATVALNMTVMYNQSLQKSGKSDPKVEKDIKDYKLKVSIAADLQSKNNNLQSVFSKVLSTLINDSQKMTIALNG